MNSKGWADYGIGLDGQTKIMGVLNVTPDSFSDGGRFFSVDTAVEQALLMVRDGADMIDVGGESSRPGATPVSVSEEIKRVVPVIKEIRKQTDSIISVDTYKADVAESALRAGADWVNDISALRFDTGMLGILKQFNCPVIIMHMQGKPQTMQKEPYYKDVIKELLQFFKERIKYLRNNSVTAIIIDPGIGFGKRLSDNLSILQSLQTYQQFQLPVMVGASRKSFIGAISGDAEQHRLGGSIASNLWAVEQGCRIVRVHDVRQMRQALDVYYAIKNPATVVGDTLQSNS